MTGRWLLLIGVTICVAGCGGGTSQAQKEAFDAKIAAQREQDAAEKKQNPDSNLDRKEAEVGVGKSTRNLSGDEINETVAAPVKTLFNVKEDLAFKFLDVNLRQYEALHGRMPESHEEFMREIADKMSPKLPKLNPGERYEWDPIEKKLYVWIQKK